MMLKDTYPEVFCGFPQSLQANNWVLSYMPIPLPNFSFIINISVNTMNYAVYEVLLNKPRNHLHWNDTKCLTDVGICASIYVLVWWWVGGTCFSHIFFNMDDLFNEMSCSLQETNVCTNETHGSSHKFCLWKLPWHAKLLQNVQLIPHVTCKCNTLLSTSACD